MVLYHCVSQYHILEAIVHRHLYHRHEYAVLVMADFSTHKFKDYRELNSFFDQVVLLPYRSIQHNPASILSDIDNLICRNIRQDIKEFADIYVAAAHYYFSLYLIANQIGFHFMEDGCGILSKPKVSYDIVHNYAPVQADIAQTYGLFDGTAPFILDCICNVSAQSFPISGRHIVDFDVVKALRSCEADYISKILHFFRVGRIPSMPKGGVLLFTQQLANLGVMDFEDQAAIYQIAVDFFMKDRPLLFKIHPDDVMYYSLLFPNSRDLAQQFPAELLPVMVDSMPDTSFTVYSSSVLSLKSTFKHNMFCGYDYGTTFRRTDRYYFALDILCQIHQREPQKPDENRVLISYGADASLIDNLLQYAFHQNNLKFVHEYCLKKPESDSICYLIDDPAFISDIFRNSARDTRVNHQYVEVSGVPLNQNAESVQVPNDSFTGENTDLETDADLLASERDSFTTLDLLRCIGPNDTVVFLNSNKDYCFYDFSQKTYFEHMIPVRIHRSRLREENVYTNCEDAILYFYTMNKEISSMIRRFQKSVELNNSGILETVQPMTAEQERIAVLEGILEATEKRLLYYINKERTSSDSEVAK